MGHFIFGTNADSLEYFPAHQEKELMDFMSPGGLFVMRVRTVE